MALAKDEQGVERDEQGRVRQVKLDAHVLDPNSPEAVQVPIGVRDVDPLTAAYGDSDDIEPQVDQNVKIGDLSHDEIVGAGQHGPSKANEAVAEAEAEQYQADADEARARDEAPRRVSEPKQAAAPKASKPSSSD